MKSPWMQPPADWNRSVKSWWVCVNEQARDLVANDNMSEMQRWQVARDLEKWAASRKEWSELALAAAKQAQDMRRSRS